MHCFLFPFCNHQCQLFDWLVSMMLGVKVFLPEWVDLCVVDSRESFCLVKLDVEQLAGCGDLCPSAVECTFVVPHWVSLQGSSCRRPS
jgi:hypothetical protein